MGPYGSNLCCSRVGCLLSLFFIPEATSLLQDTNTGLAVSCPPSQPGKPRGIWPWLSRELAKWCRHGKCGPRAVLMEMTRGRCDLPVRCRGFNHGQLRGGNRMLETFILTKFVFHRNAGSCTSVPFSFSVIFECQLCQSIHFPVPSLSCLPLASVGGKASQRGEGRCRLAETSLLCRASQHGLQLWEVVACSEQVLGVTSPPHVLRQKAVVPKGLFDNGL